jgi:hypothetical protein
LDATEWNEMQYIHTEFWHGLRGYFVFFIWTIFCWWEQTGFILKKHSLSSIYNYVCILVREREKRSLCLPIYTGQGRAAQSGWIYNNVTKQKIRKKIIKINKSSTVITAEIPDRVFNQFSTIM